MTPQMAVRRLVPEECEALQGFRRGYTKISEKTADGPRYKALGNSMAVPVMRWIGERIERVDVCREGANPMSNLPPGAEGDPNAPWNAEPEHDYGRDEDEAYDKWRNDQLNGEGDEDARS